MIRDITLGQYYQTDSYIHRLDPRTKIAGTFLFIITLFLAKNAIGYCVAAAFLFGAIKLSKVPFKYMIRGMKAIIVLMLLTVIFNLFMTKGEVVFSFWKISISKEGIDGAVKMAIRLTFLILGSSLMTLTAYDDKAVGMGRLVGDGIYDTIVDVVIMPEYQGRGIGKGIVTIAKVAVDEQAVIEQSAR